MARFEPILGRISGKLGGLVFMNGPAGASLRSWNVPTNPNTPQQQTIRSAATQLANRWVATLSAAKRDAWETYAANVSVPGRFGNPIHLKGLPMYVRCNVARIQFFGGAGIKDDAPVVFNLGEYTEPVITATLPSTVSVAFNTADDWVSEDGAAMLIYSSREQNPSKNFFKGPYRPLAAAILGNLATPPPSPTLLATPFPVTSGNKLFFFARVMRNDGRMSAEWRGVDLTDFV